MGALSIDQGAGCLKAREIDGIIIGDGLSAGSVDAFLTVLAEDARFRDLPVAVLGAGCDAEKLPNFVRARDPAGAARARGAVHPDAGARKPRSSACCNRSNAKA